MDVESLLLSKFPKYVFCFMFRIGERNWAKLFYVKST